MICLVDYGVGNLFSLTASLKMAGGECVVSGDPEIIKKADKIILPGVGAFEDAAKKLRAEGLDKVIIEETEKGKPLLGICLGMQLLFEKSYEFGEHEGLGLIKGNVVPMEGFIPSELKIPHIGWNALCFTDNKCPIFKYNKNGDYVYFVHSFFASDCEESVTAVTEYGKPITAAAACGNVMGVQFHPEKSGEAGISMLKAFCEL
ncbi:MAG: imidazole glycerol phosphate synthase subunit HisH [Christensenellaceae bacterium]|nr:imidazole glycerol phosphate synthase subunit HisH [Christensenellaceae bacterium]